MCFNFKTSITTFFISWLISIYILLFKNLNIKQKHEIIFLMIYSSMQLVDAILWYNNMKHNNINYYTTSFIIPIILSLQIIYNIFIINKYNNYLIITIVISTIIYMFKRFNGYSSSLQNNILSSPIWASNEIKLWELFLFLFLSIYPSYIKIFNSLLIFIFIKFFIGGAYGTLWCSIVNLSSFYYLYNY